MSVGSGELPCEQSQAFQPPNILALGRDALPQSSSAAAPSAPAAIARSYAASGSSTTITIRTEPHSVMQAINRQVGHYAHHLGQIVFLAKHFAGANWQTLSVPRRKSADFNRRVAAGEASQR